MTAQLLGKGSWESRNAALTNYFSSIIRAQCPSDSIGIDIGAGDGALTQQLQKDSDIQIIAFEPFANDKSKAPNIKFVKGLAHFAPFKDESIDVVIMASVYEHIFPKLRHLTLTEIRRVLKPHGILIGEMPNMYFPVEIHSQLPLQQFFPYSIGDAYFRAFSHEIWRSGHQDWFRISPKQLLSDAKKAGFRKGVVRGFEYPIECIPPSLRFANSFLKLFPIVYVFQFLK